jgi:hypothetical protein
VTIKAGRKMHSLKEIEPVKLICGFIIADDDAFAALLDILEDKFGDIQFESESFDFEHTSYYEKEMGGNLRRSFVSFSEPVKPDSLKDTKLATIGIEKRFLNDGGGRLVNIDPGLLGLANLALASTKEYSHRLYLGDGIFGEVTMLYENRNFQPLPWTYPDYRRPELIEFLIRTREDLKEHIIMLRQEG